MIKLSPLINSIAPPLVVEEITSPLVKLQFTTLTLLPLTLIFPLKSEKTLFFNSTPNCKFPIKDVKLEYFKFKLFNCEFSLVKKPIPAFTLVKFNLFTITVTLLKSRTVFALTEVKFILLISVLKENLNTFEAEVTFFRKILSTLESLPRINKSAAFTFSK